MPSSVLQRLREHRRKQLEERLNVGPKWRNDFSLVFTARGRRLHGTVVTHMFQKRLDEEGLRRLRFHDLPHSCDTLLQALGVPQRVVMEILGHTTLAMTMERYATALPDARADAARRIDVLLSGEESVRMRSSCSSSPMSGAGDVRLGTGIANSANSLRGRRGRPGRGGARGCPRRW